MPRGARRPATRALDWRDHGMAVVASGLLSPMPLCLLALVGLAFAAVEPLSLGHIVFTIASAWVVLALVSLVGATVLFTALWPLTRREGRGSGPACLVAAALAGAAFAFFAWPGGNTLTELVMPVVNGIIVGGVYRFALARRRRRRLARLTTTFG